jgi:hypothetical protein
VNAELKWDHGLQIFTDIREWNVYRLPQWTLYLPLPGQSIVYNPGNYNANDFEHTSRDVGSFVRKEIDWNGFHH